MSYHTRVGFIVKGQEVDPTIQSDAALLLEQVKAFITQAECFCIEEFLEDAARLIGGEHVILNHWYVEYAEDLLAHLSRAFPETLFGMRGMGEEFEDLWIRYAKGGEVLSSRPAK